MKYLLVNISTINNILEFSVQQYFMKKHLFYCPALMLFSLFGAALTIYADSPAENIVVGEFSKGLLSGWEEEEFSGNTVYTLVLTEQKTETLKAVSNKTASGLFKKVKIDLNKTPYLNWSWKIDHTLKDINELSKKGDDYAARIYVVKKHPLFFWKTRALNYVWSSNQPQFSQWDNAYTSQAKMLALQGKDSPVQQWFIEKRNVKEDLKKMFAVDIDSIDAVAIMTDTDNSGQSVSAWYGDIYFSAR